MNHTMNMAYPLHFDRHGRTASAGSDEHVREMIEQLLFTSPGERVNRPDFGSGLMQLVFAPNSPEYAAALQFTVEAALQRWLGDVIQVSDLDVSADDSTLRISLTYSLVDSGEERNATFSRPL